MPRRRSSRLTNQSPYTTPKTTYAIRKHKMRPYDSCMLEQNAAEEPVNIDGLGILFKTLVEMFRIGLTHVSNELLRLLTDIVAFHLSLEISLWFINL